MSMGGTAASALESGVATSRTPCLTPMCSAEAPWKAKRVSLLANAWQVMRQNFKCTSCSSGEQQVRSLSGLWFVYRGLRLHGKDDGVRCDLMPLSLDPG